MQIETFLRRITLSSVACLALPYFSLRPINGKIFSKKKLLNTNGVFVFFLQLLCVLPVIPKIIHRDIVILHRSSCKVPDILVTF